MAPRKRKEAEAERRPRGAREEGEGAPREAADAREEEGYAQPESSAQKGPRRPDEPPPGHPE